MKRAILAATMALCSVGVAAPVWATPANLAVLGTRYGRFLPARQNACTTCHQNAPGEKAPISLTEFPHNAFGARLKSVGESLQKSGQRSDIARRLEKIAREDSDADGVPNETELLLEHNPGDAKDKPTAAELAGQGKVQTAFAAFRSEYKWQPFESVVAPPVPISTSANPIDAFLAIDQKKHGLTPRPQADRRTLLRRVTLDLTGLSPTESEMDSFLADKSPAAYEKVIDRLLASPRYGERWGRHFMDVWRYSDWAGWADGGQIRDSQPHIWRWRDWIIESLNADKGYDRMVQEMLAADELAPSDPQALRATGFLARNYKLLSREQWLEDTVNHTSKAFLGITMHCAKCHTHLYDPIPQSDYYRFRAIFEPHQVRQDRVPGELDTTKDGLPRVYDADLKAPTYLFVRGDERNPDKSQMLTAGVPESLGGKLTIRPVNLPLAAIEPDRRPFVIQELIADSNKAVLAAFQTRTNDKAPRAEYGLTLAQARHRALLAVLEVEALADAKKDTKAAAELAVRAQREVAVAEGYYNRSIAEKADQAQAAIKAIETAEAALKQPLTTSYTPRIKTYPTESTGRRLALARWLTERQNPLTARVAVNHLWLRHFGQALVPSVADFGRNGRKPTHPQLLDWLSVRFMENGWKFKDLHRLILMSDAYRRDSRPDTANLAKDPDNLYLWRKSPLRLEAEAVRDNVLYAARHLDETHGGPEIDHNAGLTSKRRSLYLRNAAEKQSEFLQIFDGPSVTECYERKPSVLPQQALALANSELALREARALAKELTTPNAPVFVKNAFERILSRPPTTTESVECLRFLATGDEDSLPRRYENLILVLFNHNDFVTVR